MGTRMSKENNPSNVYHLMSDKDDQSKSHQKHDGKHTKTIKNTYNQSKYVPQNGHSSNHQPKHKKHHKNDSYEYKNNVNRTSNTNYTINATTKQQQPAPAQSTQMDTKQAIDTLQSMFVSIDSHILKFVLMEQCQANLTNAVEILLTMQAASTSNQGRTTHSVPSTAPIKPVQQSQPLFESHMRLKDAFKLNINDEIDHRDLNEEARQFGRFFPATILEKKGTNLKIHYNGYPQEYDTWSDFGTEIHRFATPGSMSTRPSYRFFELKPGDSIRINPSQRHEGWKSGIIQKMDDTSGQIKVQYEYNGNKYLYWAHLDNTLEIGEFIINSKVICKISSYVIKWKRMILVDSFIDKVTKHMVMIMPVELNKLIFVYFDSEPSEELKETEVMENFDFMIEIEQPSLYKIMNDEHEIKFNEDELRQIFNHWITKKKADGFRNEIIECIRHCIRRDNVEILKTMWRMDKIYTAEISEFINIAAKYGSFNCIAFLFNYVHELDWTNEKRPICLFNAIRYQHNDLKLIHFIMEQLETLKILFICDEIMNEVIRYDIADVAKRIIANRWHELILGDRLYAQSLNGKCNELFNEKSNAFFVNIDLDNNDDYGLNLDDDEWGHNKQGTDNN